MHTLKYFCLILYIFPGNGVILAVSLFLLYFLVILANRIEAFVENLGVCVCVCMCMHACVCASGYLGMGMLLCWIKKKEFLHLLLAAEKFFLNTIPAITHPFKHFTYFILFDTYNNPVISVLLFFPFTGEESETERGWIPCPNSQS